MNRVSRRMWLGVFPLLLALGGCDPRMTGQPAEPSGPIQGPSAAQATDGWVIVLDEYSDANRVQNAQKMVEWLRGRGWSGVSAMMEPGRGRCLVYLGPFSSYSDPRLTSMLKDVKAYTDDTGRKPFALAYTYELPSAAPEEHPEWNLANAKGFWTLQIAYCVEPRPAFPTVDPAKLPPNFDRRRLAMEMCKALRDQGVEAYYHHGPTISAVTVGTFGPEVFSHDMRTDTYVGYDPAKEQYTHPDVRYYTDREDFKYNLENGLKVKRRYTLPGGRFIERYRPSLLVRIPRKGSDIIY